MANNEESFRQNQKDEVKKKYKVGDIITFGSYPFYKDGREKAIDWIILDIDADNNALLISDYALDNVSYFKQLEDVTWETSSIRQWLNNDFLNMAFTLEEASKILATNVENKDNQQFKIKGGNNTRDKVFLLSIEESEKYFNNNEERIAYPTPYAMSYNSVNGDLSVDVNHFNKNRRGSCWWWLRSPGFKPDHAASVDYGGLVFVMGFHVLFADYGAVRPALKINLNEWKLME